MAVTFKIKRSVTPAAVPASLEDGELAINQADAMLFWKDDVGTIHQMSLLAPGVPGGSEPQVQFNDDGSFGGAAKLGIQAEGYPAVGESTYSAAVTQPTDGVAILSRVMGGDAMLSSVGSGDAREDVYETHGGYKRTSLMMADPDSTTPYMRGITPSISGFSSSGTLASTNLLTATPRITYTTDTLTNSSAGLAATIAHLYRGTSAIGGGFHVVMTFGAAGIASDSRLFVGLKETMPSAVTDPSVYANMIGLAKDEGDTNLQIMYAGTSGTQTKIDLGSALDPDRIYKVIIGCKHNSSGISITVYEYSFSGINNLHNSTVTSVIPAAGLFLRPAMIINTGATSSTAVSLDFINIHTKTDF